MRTEEEPDRSPERRSFDAGREVSKGSSAGLVLGLLVSGIGHVSLICLLIFIPSHLPSLSVPTAYTVEIVNPGALGGSLGGGGPGPGKKAAASVAVQPKRPAPNKAEKKLPGKKPKAGRAEKKPEVKKRAVKKPPVKKARPKKVEARKPREIKLAKAHPAPTPAKPKPTPVEKKRERSKTAGPKPAATRGARVKKRAEKPRAATSRPKAAKPSKPSAGTDAALDRRLAAAVERVGKKPGPGVGPGDGGAGPASVGPGEGPGGGGVVRGIEFLVYYNAMRSRIRDSWTWVGTDEKLSAKVRFGIEANGAIVNVRLVQSSGDHSYDESVLRALRRVGKLDPPPAKYRRDFGDVELEFTPGDLERRG